MLEGIDSTKVFYYFEQISNIPRGSGNNTAISNYLVDFAKEHELRYLQDEAENVIIWKDASKGQEEKPVVILQGHMDMVCEKESGSKHDFTKDPLELQIDGDFIYAKGTTLGGDDGIAMAYALAILEDTKLVHPPLEVIITTDEETGMGGAIALDASQLKGTYMLNLDSEEEGILLTSCAGGRSVNGFLPFNHVKKEGYPMDIQISGLQGGHSGTEINKNRENAVYVLGRILVSLKHQGLPFYFISLEGGLKDNAIPREAKVSILVKDKEKAQRLLENIIGEIKKEWVEREDEAIFTIKAGAKDFLYVAEAEFNKQLLLFMELAPNGVQKMSAAISGLVESSLNLGICCTKEDGVFFSFSIRSSIVSYGAYIGLKLKDLIEYLGGTYEEVSSYPAWEYQKDSKLRDWMKEIYIEQYGKSPVIEAIHAGLECGIISQKMPELDIVSIGPDIYDIHTTKERLSISSTKRVYQYVLRVLERICEG